MVLSISAFGPGSVNHPSITGRFAVQVGKHGLDKFTSIAPAAITARTVKVNRGSWLEAVTPLLPLVSK